MTNPNLVENEINEAIMMLEKESKIICKTLD
jgi:hypothetical protein